MSWMSWMNLIASAGIVCVFLTMLRMIHETVCIELQSLFILRIIRDYGPISRTTLQDITPEDIPRRRVPLILAHLVHKRLVHVVTGSKQPLFAATKRTQAREYGS